MQYLSSLAIFFLVLSLGRCQFTRSAFENIGLGEAPNGVYIPQDSFLNALRNPSYRSRTSVPAPASNLNYNLGVNYANNAQQPSFYTPTSSVAMNMPQDQMAPPVMDGLVTDTNTEERRPRRRTIRIRQRVSNQQIGNPMRYSPSVFENVGLGEVPDGVYIPPDSLFNSLRNPSQTSYQRAPAANVNFGLIGTYENNRQQLYEQPPAREQPKPILSDQTPSVQFVAPRSDDLAEEEYGRKLVSMRRQSTQSRQMPSIRPSSLALDPSMEYPADMPREEMQSLARSNVEYIDMSFNNQQSNGAETPRRRPSQRRRKQTKVRPTYEEPEYPTKSYSPSIFQNIGLGQPPSGVSIPSDSMLNLLRNQAAPPVYQQQTVRKNTMPRQSSDDALSINDEYMPDNSSRPSQTRRKASRQRSQQVNSSEESTRREDLHGEPTRTFRESSQQRQRSHQRNLSSNRRMRNEE